METILFFDLIFAVVLFAIYLLAKKKQLFKNLLIGIYILVMIIYLGWRIFYTLPTEGIASIIAGGLLLIAELGGFLLSLVFYTLFIRKNKQPVKGLESLNNQYPTVDIYIATYNEDEMILKRAMIAARELRYPEKDKVKVYVLDDGHRDSIEKLAKEVGVGYLNRPTHEHAKAGNLNNGLQKTSGELIVTMDADMVPRADFLERTVGYFSDPELAFVQTPQTFFNHDPYQFNLFSTEIIGNDQDFFMQGIEAQKDAYNATMYVGSNAIFRRKALEDIGGFSTGVITEDMATGMLIQAKGWKTRFVNENLASGLAPETFGDLIKQRDRWARGNIQVIRKWNPLRLKGLSLMQKIIYMDGIHYWISGIYKMIYMLAPICFLLLGIYSLQASLEGILAFWLPAFIASQLSFNIVSEKKQTVLLTNVYETVMAPYMAYAVIGEGLFKAKNKFVVTRKGVSFDQTYYNWRLAMPVLILLILSVASLIKGLLIYFGVIPFGDTYNAIYINLFWILYNLFALVLAAFISFERPRFRKAERFSTNKPIVLLTKKGQTIASGQLKNWNEIGAGTALNSPSLPVAVGDEIILAIDEYHIPAKVIRQITTADGKMILSVLFKELTDREYTYIISQTYAIKSTDYQPKKRNNSVWQMFGKLIQQYSRATFTRKQ